MKKLIALAGVLLAVTATAGAAATAGTSAQDENWLQTSISGDRFEIAGGKIALSRGLLATTRALGARLVKDHSKSLQESIVLAHRLGVSVPPAATPSMQWELSQVATMPRSSFDVAYTSLEFKDHQQDIEETAFEVHKGQSAQVVALARQELPMLNLHLAKSKGALHDALVSKKALGG